MDEAPLLAIVGVALGVGVPRDVEPVASPTLAVAGRRQEPVDDVLEGARGRIALEVLDLRGGGGKAVEIVGRAADQRPAVGGPRGTKPSLLERRQDEEVDGTGGPARVADCGKRR